jgi:hypothetical protein
MRRVLLLVSSGLLVSGCASRIRTELVGTGHGVVTTRANGGSSEPSAAPGGGGIPLPRGTYDFDLRIGVSRTQLVDWKVTCAGAEQTGTVGEAFDAYRERRLARLEQEREQQAKYLAQATTQPPPPVDTGEAGRTMVVVARPPVATVRTPVGRVVVAPGPVVTRTQVHAPPPAPVVAIDGPLELPPGDLGQGVFPARVRVVTQADGVCQVTALADDPNVSAFFSVTRVRDLGVEEAERKQLVYVGAVDTRGKLTEKLIAYGADPDAKQRRLDAEAKLRAEAEAKRNAELATRHAIEQQVAHERRLKEVDEEQARRLRREAEAEKLRLQRVAAEHDRRIKAELEARAKWEADAPKRAALELELRQREVSIKYRLTLIAWLVGECHADPDRRGRIAREEERVRRERQAKLEIRLEIERIERERILRIKLEAERVQREKLQAERERRIAADRAERQRRDEELENQRAIERSRRERESRELAELELRRTNEAMRVRTTLTGHLVAFGARIRPPRPELRHENPGPTPFDGAVWASGRWEWISMRGEWVWHGGGWRDSGRGFGEAGSVANERPTVIVETAPPPITTTTVTVETAPPPVVIVPSPTVVIEVGGRVAPRGNGYRPRGDSYRPAPRKGYRPTPQGNDTGARRYRKDDDKKQR